MKPVRLDRLLANLGYGSRGEIAALIAAGAVRLDGAIIARPDGKVRPESDLTRRLSVEGEPVDSPPPLSLVMNKPPGVVCSRAEPGRSLYDRLPPRWRARKPPLSTIGRLDAETSGLILITDDGALLHKVIAPRSHIAKVYEAELAAPLAGDEAARFASGTMRLSGEKAPLAPVRLETLATRRVRLTLHEGRYHQVRRMFAACGNRVVALHRTRIGALALPPDLAPGAFRPIEPAELAAVFAGT